MRSTILTATGLALALALPAAAQSTQSQSNNSSSSGQQSSTNVRQHVAQDLEKAGFTNVQVMPEPFLVRAKDKQGRPVMMVINPDSITAVTEVGSNGQSGSGNSSSNNQSPAK